MKPNITYSNTRTLLFLLLLTACAPAKTEQKTAENTIAAVSADTFTQAVPASANPASNSQESDNQTERDDYSPDPARINEFGLVRKRHDYPLKKLSIYNEDGSLWRTYVYSDEPDPDIEPYRMKPDYGLIVFRCIGESPLGYKVVVHEEHNTVKYIKRNEPGFIHQSWEEHLMDLTGVGFDYDTNPLKESPFNNADILPQEEGGERSYNAVSVKGDWLLVETENGTRGWIRWHDDEGVLLIALYYLC